MLCDEVFVGSCDPFPNLDLSLRVRVPLEVLYREPEGTLLYIAEDLFKGPYAFD